jgi:hypothetical protein
MSEDKVAFLEFLKHTSPIDEFICIFVFYGIVEVANMDLRKICFMAEHSGVQGSILVEPNPPSLTIPLLCCCIKVAKLWQCLFKVQN